MKKIATKKIPPMDLILESSMGEMSLGKYPSVMVLYFHDGRAGSGEIEWRVPALGRTDYIMFEWNNDKTLIEYSGVFSLPKPAVDFLRAQGFTVPKDFY